MQVRIAHALVALAVVPLVTACESNKSANPLSPSVAGPIPGVEITAPTPLQPQSNAQVPTDSQPLTLMIENAASNGQRPLSYRLEISSDQNFTSLVFSKDGLTPGADGKTSFRLPDKLASDRTYYWRARAQDGANTGPFSNPVKFTVVTPIEIMAPTPVSPIGGVVAPNPPQMTFKNAERTGPVGPITYRLEVARDQAFTSVVYREDDVEIPDETRMTPHTPLPDGLTFYWRVRASDPSHTGPWSSTATFKTAAAPVPAPEPDPGQGGGGDSGGGSGGDGSCASSSGPAIINCISAKYASYRRAGVSSSQRRANMEFLRDRIIEAGLCGGLDLGWNLKRGGPEKSADFITERRGGSVIGHDIAYDYDNTSTELRLNWGGGDFPFYAKYTNSYSCK
jgi:hypothetical protein